MALEKQLLHPPSNKGCLSEKVYLRRDSFHNVVRAFRITISACQRLKTSSLTGAFPPPRINLQLLQHISPTATRGDSTGPFPKAIVPFTRPNM